MKRAVKRGCPKCGSRNVARIQYGFITDFGGRLGEELAAGKVVLGGCVISDDGPTKHCNSCRHEWRPNRSEKAGD